MSYSELRRGRASIGWQIYLVTTVTRERARLFTNLYFGRFVVRALHSQTAHACAQTLAYVVMPDHLHWLLQMHPGCKLSAVVQSAKGRSAIEINRARAIASRCGSPTSMTMRSVVTYGLTNRSLNE